MVKEEGRRYKVFHTVLVTDSNGTPVSNADITLTIYPSYYSKAGTLYQTGCLDNERDVYGNCPCVTDEDNICKTAVTTICRNEDENRNGILDAGEDINNNGRLDPGSVITVDNLQLTTNEAGFADFSVIYAIQFANWIQAELTARASVVGSEGGSIIPFTTVCTADDAVKGLCPIQNPFSGLYSEDLNKNGQLDAGEDTNGNGILDEELESRLCNEPF